MSELQYPEDLQPGEERQPPRGHPLLAWCVILVIVALVVLLQERRPAEEPAKESAERLQRKARESEARLLIGFRDLLDQGQVPPAEQRQLRQQIDTLDHGTYRQRLETAVLAGELLGPEEALDRLAQLKKAEENDKPAPSDKERRLWKSLHRLYTAYSKDNYADNVLPEAGPTHLIAQSFGAQALAPAGTPLGALAQRLAALGVMELDAFALLPEEQKEELREELGWFGRLALAPPKSPDQEARAALVGPVRRLVIGLLVGFLTMLGLCVLGFIGLVVLLVLLFNGSLRRGFVPGSPSGGVYAETFAVWLVLYVGLLVLGAFIPASRFQLLVSVLLTLVSLVALAWPVWRGVPWSQVRQDVGLHRGRGAVRETASGVASYIVSLPLLVIGLIAVFVLLGLQQGLGGRGMPMHPVAGMVNDDWVVRLQIVLAATVTAPLVEETMFRGVLYRHLREATRGWGFAASFLVSGLVNTFLFAVVHPQGLVAVPALMALALGFTLAREWRGSLIPCMVAHGLSNGLVTLLAFSTLGS
ncbi:MAG TPA: CPBP family intramembrane glutamic endopeptidase [Gemmataceae bacterium]|nr:CPBP family intramembrane glutamic endopeptidase [Gemmataceae bacterium]